MEKKRDSVALFVVRWIWAAAHIRYFRRAYSTALPMSSTTFLASPNTIMVLSM